jgi:hypothetical protein
VSRNPPKRKKRRRQKRPRPRTPDGPFWCTQCHEWLPRSAFCIIRRTGQPNSWCKACHNAHQARKLREDPERARAAARRRYRKRRKKQLAYQRRPEIRFRNAARQMVHQALRLGLIEKPEACERCGAKPPPRRLHAHHLDYEKPLEIVWLCSLCHGEEHRKTRDEGA